MVPSGTSLKLALLFVCCDGSGVVLFSFSAVR